MEKIKRLIFPHGCLMSASLLVLVGIIIDAQQRKDIMFPVSMFSVPAAFVLLLLWGIQLIIFKDKRKIAWLVLFAKTMNIFTVTSVVYFCAQHLESFFGLHLDLRIMKSDVLLKMIFYENLVLIVIIISKKFFEWSKSPF